MKKYFKIAFSLWLIFVGYASSAQVETPDYGYFLTGKTKNTRIPFEMHANLIIVPIHINRSDTLYFILDTGVSSVIVTDPHCLDKQTLKFTRRVQLTGAGERTTPVSASVAISNTITMGHMKATYQNIVVLDEDIIKLSEYVGRPIHGIFGFDVFNHFVVTIDFRNKEIILTNPEQYKYKNRYGDKYPIIIEDTKPYADMIALVEGGEEKPIRVVIDTGAGHALLLDQDRDRSIRLPEKVIRAQLGRGLNGVINGSIGRIEKIKMGKYVMQDVLASFPDSVSFGSKISTEHARHGNMGCELLRRFTVTFNYRERYMILKPIPKQLREKFEHDMSGLELRANSEKLQQYFIDRVAAGSPAWAAGLQEGDELVFINNSSSKNMTISEIYKILQRGEGKEVNLLIKRDNSLKVARFYLKRMI